jgi:hypothetical protein
LVFGTCKRVIFVFVGFASWLVLQGGYLITTRIIYLMKVQISGRHYNFEVKINII